MMEINQDTLLPFLIFGDTPIKYSEKITLYPAKMADILNFQTYISSFTLRKNSVFPVKKIIKMSYIDFLLYAHLNPELGMEYGLPHLSNLYFFAISLLKMVCRNDIDISEDGHPIINGQYITSEDFDNMRRIIIAQNDVDFDIDEFIHHDTEEALRRAKEFEEKKNKEKHTIEDYIDTAVVGLRTTEEHIKSLTIRKFWRYIKRLFRQEEYQTFRTAEFSGMVTFKDPIAHWSSSIECEDKYSNLKTDEKELRSKIE